MAGINNGHCCRTCQAKPNLLKYVADDHRKWTSPRIYYELRLYMRLEAGVKLNSWQEIGSDGDVLLTPYVPKGITGYDDEDDDDDTPGKWINQTMYV
jgi:hypothetical protein